HKTCGPGAPSPVRARNPPSLAIHNTTCAKVGAVTGGCGTRWMLQYNACHSSSPSSTVQGKSASILANMLAYKMRQAMMEYSVKATARRSTVSSCLDSMRHPVFNTRCQTSIVHRQVYQCTRSIASSTLWVGTVVN